MKLIRNLFLASATIGQTFSMQLEVHFDVNGTIMASDLAQGRGNESSVLQEIAKETHAQWTTEGKIQNYREFVNETMLPGDEVKDQSLKKTRRQKYEKILAHLEEIQHPEYASIKNRFDTIMKSISEQDTPLFKSFWKMVNWLEGLEKKKKITYKIVFRTFGHDIPAIQKMLKKKGFPQAHMTVFKNGKLHDGDTVHEINHHDAVQKALATDKFNAVQDDHKYWNSNGEKREFGKPFYVNHKSSTPVRIFFDDNLIEKEIIYPLSLEGELLNVQELIDSGHLVNVKTLDAIADEDYFINRIKPHLD